MHNLVLALASVAAGMGNLQSGAPTGFLIFIGCVSAYGWETDVKRVNCTTDKSKTLISFKTSNMVCK